MLKLFLFFVFINKLLFGEISDVFFIEEITPSNMVKILEKCQFKLIGNVALKVHTGEKGGKYFLKPKFLENIYNYTNGTFIECNAAYEGSRHTTELHKSLLKEHGWLDNNFRTVIMDENSTLDWELNIENWEMINKSIVGEHLHDFNTCIVISHFTGHPMSGYAGALKQLSNGFASQKGKALIHTAGKTDNWTQMNDSLANDLNFTSAMGDAASSIVKYFRNKGNITFINVMSNISLKCDCWGASCPTPIIQNFGIFGSLDPVALDMACIDMINNYSHIGKKEWFDQFNKHYGENILNVSERHGIGSKKYNFINITEPVGMRTDAGLILFICIIVSCILIAGSLALCFSKKSKESKEKAISLVERKEE